MLPLLKFLIWGNSHFILLTMMPHYKEFCKEARCGGWSKGNPGGGLEDGEARQRAFAPCESRHD